MKALSKVASARPMACISETSISHLPRKCCETSFPDVTSGRLSEKYVPPSISRATLGYREGRCHTTHSARSRGVADLPIGARRGSRHHRGHGASCPSSSTVAHQRNRHKRRTFGLSFYLEF